MTKHSEALREALDVHFPTGIWRQPCGNHVLCCGCDESLWGIDRDACRAAWRLHVVAALATPASDVAPVAWNDAVSLAKQMLAHLDECDRIGKFASIETAHIRQICAALKHISTPAEPVAWLRMNRDRTKSTGVTDTTYYRDLWEAEGDDVRPLYTHPPLAQSVDQALLARAETAWQRFFYPANDCFDNSPAANKLPFVDLELADCLRLLLSAVGHEVRPPAGGEVSIAQSVDPVAGEALARSVMAEVVDNGRWSLRFDFGKGDMAMRDMRSAADMFRPILAALQGPAA